MPAFSAAPVPFASAANTTPVHIATGPGRLVAASLYNTAASARYVMLFDSVAAPTPGTTPPTYILPIPSLQDVPAQDGLPILQFTNGLWAYVSTVGTLLGNTAGTVNDVIGQLFVGVSGGIGTW